MGKQNAEHEELEVSAVDVNVSIRFIDYTKIRFSYDEFLSDATKF